MADHTADPNVIELGERNPKMNESYADSVSTVHDEPARSDFIGMRYAEDDPAVSSMGHGDSQTDLGIEERRGGYGNDVGMRLACPPVGCSSTDGQPAVYSNPRYSSPQRSNLRRLPSLDRLPSRAASNSTVNAPSVNASTAELVDGKSSKPKDDNSPKAKIVGFFTYPKYEKPRALALIILLIIVLILIIVLPIVLTRRAEEPIKDKEPVVAPPMAKIVCAWLAGVYEKNISVFKGIPYALAPTGRNRWKPPRELVDDATCKVKFPNNTGTLPTRADFFGPRCYQRIKNGYIGGSEDCLTLNVWTPTANDTGAGMPVIVFFHGGQLSFGGGDEINSYGVHKFVKKHNVVVVSMNYRLGPFGFMTLKEFPDFRDTGMSGNYGLMDQIAALQWVKENIKNFGGAPTKVTLLGWESGGSSVLALLNSEKATYLFHHAWIMDAGFIKDQTLNDTHTVNNAFLTNTKCSGAPNAIMDCLYAMAPDAITQSVPWLDGSRWSLPQMYKVPKKDEFMAALITVDGLIVKNSTNGMLLTNTLENKVPIVFGTGEDGADLDPPYFEKGRFPYLSTSQQVAVATQLEAFSFVLTTLPQDYEKKAVNHEHAYMMMVTDMRARCPTSKVAVAFAKVLSQPVYHYIFKVEPAIRIDALGRGFWSKYAFRGVDMLAAFGAVTGSFSNYFTGRGKFEESMQKNLAEFATSGKIALWNFLPNEYMVLNDTAAESRPILGDISYQDCSTFEEVGLDMKYAWMN